ncbi:flagellar hook assembly protein FlgD [Massilia glaciei]|uniref:Basal-body rod modification protein FlgD n=1 Tax=Massilia glaciei TaxID=1524097 RepID=A0A2U2HGR1_9BURK|nr:flagellar hook assembly protein FlgD [Massilia glaciei]PWF44354.1 flagellar hook assembly protein FlgD [Massilia glaciei]
MTAIATQSPPIINDLMAVMNPRKAAAVAGSVQADQDKFMTLLVTQLKNQDPMNPLDNAQITSQLAQLSTVTGVNKLNTTLESLKASYQSSEALQAANMIGHGVLVEGNSLTLHEGKSIMGVELGSSVDNLQIVITDPRTGKDVHTLDLGPHGPGVTPVAWDGVIDGVPSANGAYTFRVVAQNGGEAVDDAIALAFDSVGSVTTSAKNGVQLNLMLKGSMVTMADVKLIM